MNNIKTPQKHEREIHNPFNFGFELIYDSLAADFHVNLGIPGIFFKKCSKSIIIDGRILEADACYMVLPDYITLHEKAIAIVEHQSKEVNNVKIVAISDYEIGKIQKTGLPPLTVVACHLDKSKSVQKYARTPSYITQPLFLDLDEENNTERLSTLRDNINSDNELSISEALNIGTVVLFAPRERGLEITEEVIGLYDKLSIDNEILDFTLYGVLYAMIDAYSIYEHDFRRLKNMLDETTETDIINKFDAFQKVHYELEIAKKEQQVATDRIHMLESDNATQASKISSLESENENKDSKISFLESENENKDSKISSLEAKNLKLQRELDQLRRNAK